MNCYDWLSFGGTQFKTTGFKNIGQSTAGFECTDKTDCCKYTPKAGPALFWVDQTPYDTFTGTTLDTYIPHRYSQHRMKYQAKSCAPLSRTAASHQPRGQVVLCWPSRALHTTAHWRVFVCTQ